MKLVYVILLPIFFAYAIWSEFEKMNLKVLSKRFFDFYFFLVPLGTLSGLYELHAFWQYI